MSRQIIGMTNINAVDYEIRSLPYSRGRDHRSPYRDGWLSEMPRGKEAATESSPANKLITTLLLQPRFEQMMRVLGIDAVCEQR